jgi:PAS domain S-box-containing protein
MKQLLDLSLEIYHSGLDTGDLVYAGLGVFHLANFGIASGMNLNEYIKTVSAYRKIVDDLGQDYTYRMTGIGLQTAQNLMTPSPEPDVFEERYFDENHWLPEAIEANDGLTLFLVFQAKLLLSYHFDRDGSLMEYSGEAEKYLESVHGMSNIGIFRFYDSLSRLRLYRSLSADERELALKRVESNQLRMRIWAQSGPMSFQHKYDLVAAETARVSGDIGSATENYERAIKGAMDNAFIHEEALANELYARFWQERGNDKIAEMYMREACTLYHQWGADAKADHLEERYPQWFKSKTILTREPDTPVGFGKTQKTITQPVTSIQLDMESIISASQMLSAETDLEKLLNKMMELVMSSSGAEKAVLLLKRNVDWFLEAKGDITNKNYDVLLNKLFDPGDIENELIPEAVFNYCSRTKEVLVVGDVGQDDRFSKDRLIESFSIKSLACIPVLSQGNLKALLYLDNSKLSDVFTLERMEILKHLSAQFGVSVENTLLYESLNNKIQELQESEVRFRSFVENANETIIVSQDEAVKYCNPQIKELTGYSPQEMRLRKFADFIHPEDLEVVLAEYRARVSGEKPKSSYSIRIITKDGQEKYVIVNSALVDWDGRPATLALLTDITDRKIAENKLIKSEERFRNLMERSPLAVAIFTPDGHLSDVNSAWYHQWGLNRDETTEIFARYNQRTDKQLEDFGVAPLVERAYAGESVVLPPIEYIGNRARDEIEIEDIDPLVPDQG